MKFVLPAVAVKAAHFSFCILSCTLPPLRLFVPLKMNIIKSMKLLGLLVLLGYFTQRVYIASKRVAEKNIATFQQEVYSEMRQFPSLSFCFERKNSTLNSSEALGRGLKETFEKTFKEVFVYLNHGKINFTR